MNIPPNLTAPSTQTLVPPQTSTPKAQIISLIALGILSCAAIIYAAPFLAGAHITVLTVKILSSALPLISFIGAAILYTRASSQAKEEALKEKKSSLEKNFLADKIKINDKLIKYLEIVKDEFETDPNVIAYQGIEKILKNAENALLRGKGFREQKAIAEEKLKRQDLTRDERTSLSREIQRLTRSLEKEGITLKETPANKQNLEKLKPRYEKLEKTANKLMLDRAAQAEVSIAKLEDRYNKALLELAQPAQEA